MYSKKCAKCGCINTYRLVINSKELCNSCRKELPKEEKVKVFGMKDSAGIVR